MERIVGFSFVTVLLTAAMFFFLRQQKDIRRRIVYQRDVPRDELVPRHYRSFTEVENKLWAAVQQSNREISWEQVRFRVGQPEFPMVRDYVHGLREDFRRGHRIFGHVIMHCPEMRLLAQLEWERVKIELAYYHWCSLLGFRLRTRGVSIYELRQLTEIVATLAFRVRSILTALESGGDVEFVDSILRQS